MDHFTVDPAVLQAQASAVHGVAQLVEAAGAAAEQVELGGDAYGKVISPLLDPVLATLLPNVAGSIAHAADLGESIVDGLRDNSDVYQGIEDDLAQTLKTVDH
ncbi:MAG TPA: hypothetical protein VFH38_05070 [Jatrophihabitans sp.]|nr:hypothetical protein [Jatrophihabitans sp.]